MDNKNNQERKNVNERFDNETNDKKMTVNQKVDYLFDFNLLEAGLEIAGDIRNGRIQKNIKNGNVNILSAGASLLAIVAVFLPMAEVSALMYNEKITAFDINSGITIALIIACLISLLATLVGKRKISVLCGILYTVGGVVYWLQVSSVVSDSYGMAKTGLGVYLMMISGIAVIVTNYMRNNFVTKYFRVARIKKRVNQISDTATSVIRNLIDNEQCPASLKEAFVNMSSEYVSGDAKTLENVQRFVNEVRKNKQSIPAEHQAVVEEFAVLMSELVSITLSMKTK